MPSAAKAGETGHLTAVLQALLVTFLWSTSWVLIKIGLVDLPPLIFAGLRYLLASLILIGAVLRHPRSRRELAALGRGSWLLLGALGLVTYSLTQGAQFVALGEIPAVMVSLALSFTPAFVALLSIGVLAEAPTRLQWIGTFVLLTGAVLYTGLAAPAPGMTFGIVVAFIGMAANASAALLGRHVNRSHRTSPLVVTAVSMSIGSLALVAAGLAIEELPRLDAGSWAIVGWLAVVNTAFAFTLWNHTMRRLTANESSVINNTMLIQISVLAWIFFGEALSPRQIVAVLVAALGALMVQLGRSRPGARVSRAPLSADRGRPPARG
jgi:drug/metabolite transporter (DMT)-like permease